MSKFKVKGKKKLCKDFIFHPQLSPKVINEQLPKFAFSSMTLAKTAKYMYL